MIEGNMASEAPILSNHYVLEESPTELIVTLPAGRRSSGAIATVALLSWLAIEALSLYYLTRIYPLQAHPAGSEAFPPLAFVVLWTLLGLPFLAGFLWQLFGETVVRIGAEEIEVRHRVLGIGLKQTYRHPHVQNLRAEQEMGYPNSIADHRRGVSSPLARPTWQVVFDHGLKVVRLAGRMEAEEATRLAGAIVSRFPQYGGPTCSNR